MDPQKLSQLDPKLRDAYQRVMGTSVPQPQAVPASPRDEPVQAQTPSMPTPITPTPTPTPQPQPQPEPEPTPTPPPATSDVAPAGAPTPTIEEPPTAPQSPIQPPPSEPQSIPTPESSMPESQPAIPPIPEPTIPTSPPAQTNNIVQMNSEVAASPAQNFTTPSAIPQTQAVTIKKKNKILIPVLFGIVGLVFIVIYTLFWTKIFNFKLPFMP